MMLLTALAMATNPVAAPASVPIPKSFAPTGADRMAIETLLSTYTRAVSTKNRALYLTLLQDRAIPFAGVPSRGIAAGTDLHQYAAFDTGVFDGEPFTQRFQDVKIEQDGALANVSLVFINTLANGTESWGLKTLQLVKIAGQWKIASEFFTGHPLARAGDPK